jgi:hypothetical protein
VLHAAVQQRTVKIEENCFVVRHICNDSAMGRRELI